MSDDTLSAFQRVCLSETIDAADVAVLERGGGGPRGRLLLYRDLVRIRLRDLVSAAFPRTTRTIGKAKMDALADAHITAGPNQSRFFREHAETFAAWALERLPSEPAWTRDLLVLEAAQWQANYRPSPPPAAMTAFDLELVPIASRTLQLLGTSWSVHTSGDDAPQPGTFRLAVYRRPDHRVETRWMDTIWAWLLADLARGERPAIDSVRAALNEHQRTADATFVDELTTFLALVADNGALLGERAGRVMRLAAFALLLVGCGAAQRPALSGIALSYEVHVDEALRTMDVTLCPVDAPLPHALVPVHRETIDHIRSAAFVQGETRVPLVIAPRIDLSATPTGACVRYEVDLSTCTSPRGPSSCARIGRDVFAPTSTWLLAPDRRSLSAHYDLRFVLPRGVFVTPIEEGASADPSHVVLDERNFAFVTYLALTHAPASPIAVPGACMDVVTMDGRFDPTPEIEAHWLSVAAEASSRVTGQTPFDRITALIAPTFDVPGTPVLFGVAGRGMRPTVTLLASEHASEDGLVRDWTAIHELSHLLTSYVDGEDTWLSEGLATYYEEVLRARQGLLTETQAWTQLVRGFARGRAASTSGTLQQACTSMRSEHAYARVYWQGAALVFIADVAYRREGSSLDEAIARAWPHRTERTSAPQLLAWLDGAPNGTFATLATASLDQESFPDVDSVLRWLGVDVASDGTITLDENAPGSAARTALMNGAAAPASNPASCDAPR